jgi:hypothetical protein
MTLEHSNEYYKKIYDPIKEEGSWRIRANKEINDTFRKPCTLKFIIWSGHTGAMSSEKMPKTVTVRMKEIGRPQKRNTDDFEEDLKITGTRNWNAMARDRRELRWIVLEVKINKKVEFKEKEKERLYTNVTYS